MGAKKKIKLVCMDKDILLKDVAEELGQGVHVFYNKIQRDTMKYNEVEQIADKIGCEIVFRDKATGKIY